MVYIQEFDDPPPSLLLKSLGLWIQAENNKLIFSADTCDQPTITDGTVAPTDATVAVGETYTVTCGDGYTISDSGATMTCQSGGTFDQTPTCDGMYTFYCSNIDHLLISF